MINNTLVIDNMEIEIDGERNLLEVIRKAKIDLPTFCYHSEISIYGACRLCMVEVQGRGILPACSTLPEAGMKVKTSTEEIRSLRKMIIELLIASHANNCPTCTKGTACQLQNLARRMGVSEIRFKAVEPDFKVDTSSKSLVRDPNKCVLCGDCIRVCDEIQSVGAIDFAHRGSKTVVTPCFGKDLDSVECVYCGQCARVCPTGAITPKYNVNEVWNSIYDSSKTVVAHVAPAVRVALGEAFGLEPGTAVTGQIVNALRRLGFDKVFDTSFTADLTVIEEANEFISRFTKKEKMPQFTSCCPAWIKFAEQYYPEYIPNLSSCKSPQQMFGALCKDVLTKDLDIEKKDMVVVSIMPCTAKKYEASRPEFSKDGIPDTDYVLTTQELVTMIEEAGIRFNQLEPDSFDLPFGFKSGAGVIFGNTGGVTEAVLRYATETITGVKTQTHEIMAVRGEEGLKTAEFTLDGNKIRVAIVNGLGNAKKLMESIKNKEVEYDLIEVMACPGGCIGGAGQPVSFTPDFKKKRTTGLYETDKMLQLHKSQENPYIHELYENVLGKPCSHVAHEMLHTEYTSKCRTKGSDISILPATKETTLDVTVCMGTGCFIKGSQKLLKSIIAYAAENDLEGVLDVKASFCYEKCERGPVVKVGEEVLEKCDFDKVVDAIKRNLK